MQVCLPYLLLYIIMYIFVWYAFPYKVHSCVPVIDLKSVGENIDPVILCVHNKLWSRIVIVPFTLLWNWQYYTLELFLIFCRWPEWPDGGTNSRIHRTWGAWWRVELAAGWYRRNHLPHWYESNRALQKSFVSWRSAFDLFTFVISSTSLYYIIDTMLI